MHKDGESALMIPMRVGSHDVMTQSIDDFSPGFFGGRKTFVSPELPLATGRASLRLGLPADVHPFVVTGGDHTQWPIGRSDGIALALAALLSAVALRGNKKRALGFASLAGLWFFSHPVFGVTLAATAVTGAIVGISKLSPRARRWTIGLGAAAAVVAIPFVFNLNRSHDMTATPAFGPGGNAYDLPPAQQAFGGSAHAGGLLEDSTDKGDYDGRRDDTTKSIGNFRAQLSQSGMIDGVRPVALAMPSSTNEVYVQTEMVSAGKPFAPKVYFVTDAGLLVLGLFCMGCAVGLGWSERERLKARREKKKEWLTGKREAPTSPAPEAPAAAE